MSSQLAERPSAAKKDMVVERSSPRVKTTPTQNNISKSLYDNPPSSSFFPFRIALKANHLLLVYMSKLVLGQHLLSVLDYFMDKLERTLDFCIPEDPAGSEVAGTSRKLSTTERPMSWILFIPALIGLRVLFFYLSIISIVLGNGEVNAEKVQMKLIPLRRYIRSIRYYAVVQYTPEELEAKAYRCKLFIARFIYFIYESIVMTTPPAQKLPANGPVTEQQTDTRIRQRSQRSNLKKNSLNQIDDDRDGETTDDDDDKLTTNQMLDEYSALKDSSADPDYEPSDEPLSEDISSEGEASSEEEKTESQKKLNDISVSDQSPDSSMNGNASDFDLRGKSKTTTLDEQQMIELENQLVMKIMNHFKDNFNYSPQTGPSEEIFYSPIGSPPEKGYSSDSGNHSKSLSDDDIIMQRLKADANNQNQEMTATFTSTLSTNILPDFDNVADTK